MLSFKNNNNILYNKMSNSLANYGKTVVYSISCKDQTVNDTYIAVSYTHLTLPTTERV